MSNIKSYNLSNASNILSFIDKTQRNIQEIQKSVDSGNEVKKATTIGEMDTRDIIKIDALCGQSFYAAKYDESAKTLEQKFSTALNVTQGIFDNVIETKASLANNLSTSRDAIKNNIANSLAFIKTQLSLPFQNGSLFSSNDPKSSAGDQSQTIKIAIGISIKSDISSKNAAFTDMIKALETIQTQVEDPNVTIISQDALAALDVASNEVNEFMVTLSVLHTNTKNAISSNSKILVDSAVELKELTTTSFLTKSKELVESKSTIQNLMSIMQQILNTPSLIQSMSNGR